MSGVYAGYFEAFCGRSGREWTSHGVGNQQHTKRQERLVLRCVFLRLDTQKAHSMSNNANVALDPNENRSRELDQFYTCPKVASDCYNKLMNYLEPMDYRFIEPSAGTGSFLHILPPGSIGYDIDPKHPHIVRDDFLQINMPYDDNIIVIGNPPFGKNASKAVRFFNHAALGAFIIAFILPRTFGKDSILRRLHCHYHLRREWPVPDKSFLFDGKQISIPTVFQIWEWAPEVRPLPHVSIEHPDFEFTTPDKAQFAVQRIGENAGKIHHDLTKSASSHYFIRPLKPCVEAIMKMIDFSPTARMTAGNPSIAKTELVNLYEQKKQSLTKLSRADH